MKAATNWENGSRSCRSGIKTRGECSSQSCTASRRTSGVIKSPTVKNRTSVICVKRCGCRRDGSPQSQMAHHRCWRLIHAELSRLASSAWRFICIDNEKSFRTVWTELAQEFPEVFNHCAEQTLWNAARDSELQRPLTRAETVRRQQGISHEQIAEDRLWNKRPDGIAFKMPPDTKSGVICLLEFKRMSDVTSHYIVRARSVAMAQYERESRVL